MEQQEQYTNASSSASPGRNLKRRIITGAVVSVLMLGSFFVGLFLNTKDIFVPSANPRIVNVDKAVPDYLLREVDFGLYWRVFDIIKNKFFGRENIVDTQLFYGSLAGMVASLGDPYTVFLEPKTAEEFTQELSGSFQGIGAEIGIKKNMLTIIAPLPDTPAERAGLKSSDQILAVDGKDTLGMSLDRAVSLIRGPKGSEVVLTILSKDDEEAREVTIVRDEIDIVSVAWEHKDDGIAYIRVSYFNEDTEKEFREVSQEVLASDPRAIVLDLRNNPGGFLNVAIRLSSYWVDEGPVVLEKFSNGDVTKYEAHGPAVFKDIPTVVLVNQGSASASEIVAGALKDYELATLVGQRTFGKGSVQDLEELPDGSAVKITIAKWLTPSGVTIQDEGIEPDIEVELTKEDYNDNKDPQLDIALETLREKD